ncbi:hypothetical protein D3C81_1321240 [compost metagenome]
MKATTTLRPSANSPISVDGPSARISPFLTISPLLTIGRWLMHVPWFERINLCNLYLTRSPLTPLPSTVSTRRSQISLAAERSMIPSYLATIHTPESFADLCSIPVPTSGALGIRSGTACRCMFDPISARLESSFSKKGISAVATDTTCFGEISM